MQIDEIRAKSEEIFTTLYVELVSSEFRFPKGYSASILDEFTSEIIKRESGMVSLGHIVDYCIHQVYLWRDVKRWKNFTISWVFGKKAIGRFYDAKRGSRYYQDLWLKEHNLSRDELKLRFVEYKEHPMRKFIYNEYEDRTKNMLLNLEAGRAICITSTTLYAPQSPICQICIFRKECELQLKITNPELHRLRVSK